MILAASLSSEVYTLDQTRVDRSTMHVLIIGAGIGGLSLAQTLRKQKLSFEVFERDENADARFQGWAIALHSYAHNHSFVHS